MDGILFTFAVGAVIGGFKGLFDPSLCTFNLPRWFILSATNFFTLQALLVLILSLFKLQHSNSTQLLRLGLTVFMFGLFMPWMMLYNMFGGFAIQNGDSKHAHETKQHCVGSAWALTPLVVFFLFNSIELLTFWFLCYALNVRFKHFMSFRVPLG
jgi:hypothetical protein